MEQAGSQHAGAHAALAPRPPRLAHHFDTAPQQFDASKLGMWLFLATEVLLFAGLFCLYAVCRGKYPETFAYGHRYLDRGWGAINTLVLIFSSFTMALAVWAAQANQKRDLVMFLSLTLLGGVDFLGIKIIEYSHKFHENLVWGTGFYRDPHPPPATAPGPQAAAPGAAAREIKAGDATKGRELFRNTCGACHGLRGEGIPGQGKDMRGSPFIGQLDDAGLLAFVKRGRMPKDPLNTTGRMMPPRGGNSMLTDANLLDILAYVREIQRAAGGGAGIAGGGGLAAPTRDSDTASSSASAAVAAPMPVLIEKSIIPPAATAAAGLAADSDRSEAEADREQPPRDPRRDPGRQPNLHLFFGLYFCMTGLHGLHVLAGVAVIAWLWARALRGDFSSAYFTPVDLGGLYWHLVDLIWIFLFPLLYLIK